jgi:hypothetical protein
MSATLEAKTMAVDEAQARAMFKEMGLLSAIQCVPNRLILKLNKMKEWAKAPEFKDPTTPELFRLRQEILEALDEGQKIVLQKSDAVEGNGRPKENKIASPNKGKPGPKKGAEKKSGVGLDKFGSRLGSNRNKFNEALSRKVKTMAQLVEEAGLSYAPGTHVQELLNKGHIEKVEDGYRLKK